MNESPDIDVVAAPSVVLPFDAPEAAWLMERFCHGSGMVGGRGLRVGDKVSLRVPQASYLFPEHIVAHLGHGSHRNGARRIATMLRGAQQTLASLPSPGVQTAFFSALFDYGAFVVHPRHVAALGDGNLFTAADQLDAVLRFMRAEIQFGRTDDSRPN